MQICEISKCTGCFACKNICPHDAISIITDVLGKTIPKVDEDKCIHCGVCQKICPVNSAVSLNRADSAIAAISRNERDVKSSSSGGIASVFSRKILLDGGIVFGCASGDGEISQIKTNNLEDLELLRGSKYVYSATKATYKEAQSALRDGQEVLYIGTPCQIAGLKNFLRKDYEKLYTVDLICHGTPPMEYLLQHTATKVKEKKWDKVTFRGERNFYLTIYSQEKPIYSQKSNRDLYFRAFLDGLTYRDNCYSCPYARPERCSDVTLGDFWGLDRTKLSMEMAGRISVVLANTEKGKELVERCRQEIVMEEFPFETAVNPKQGNLQYPSKRHADRAVFEDVYKKKGFDAAVQATSIGATIKKEKANDRKRLPIQALKKCYHCFRRIFHRGK